MRKKAIISVGSKQRDNDENIEIVTQGEFYEKCGFFYAVYEESALSGMEGTTTTLKIKKDEISLIRMGTTNTKMEFKDKKKDVSMYNTPYGTLELYLETKDINIDVNENGGKVYIDYDMSLEGQKPLKTILNIDIKTK